MLESVVQDYIHACAKLDRDRFCKQVGMPVLVAHAAGEGLVFQSAATQMVGQASPGRPGKAALQLDNRMPVLELRSGSRQPNAEVRIGRAEENDVVIQDETVSAHHAICFCHPQTRAYLLQDLESTNGTTLNEKVLLPGRAVGLHDADVIAFGDARYYFFTPGALYDHLRGMLLRKAK